MKPTTHDLARAHFQRLFYRNGGHRVEINHRNGNKYLISRDGHDSFESLDYETFTIYLSTVEPTKILYKQADLYFVVDFLLNPVLN